jgi:2-polyprenyl-3-methyl-5-hydroxy-6-metoxy-1,4-benzoquinol methylase
MIVPTSVRKALCDETKENHDRIAFLAGKYFRKKTAKLLDVGSGDGILIKRISDDTGIKDISCVELEDVHVKKLKTYNFKVNSFDLNTDFPYKDCSFDYIIANQIIEHLYFTDNFMKEMRRVLKPDGILILSTTNLAALHSRMILLLGFMPNCLHPSTHIVGTLVKKKGSNPLYGHKSVFTGKALKGFTKAHGFKVEKYETHSMLLTPRIISALFCKLFDFGTHVNIVVRNLK